MSAKDEGPPPLEWQLEKMRDDWDQRARENARHFVATGQEQWTDDEFYAHGRQSVDEYIRNDMTNICQGKPPQDMRVLEIGCGAGRVTRALGELFGEVHAVDVSGEMIALAKKALAAFPRVYLYTNNGRDLGVLPDRPFDFAFSMIVFQHIANLEVIENYIREVHRLLRPGGLFKFQVQGHVTPGEHIDLTDTWSGAPVSGEIAQSMADRCGFDFRYRAGELTQYYWLWFFKK